MFVTEVLRLMGAEARKLMCISALMDFTMALPDVTQLITLHLTIYHKICKNSSISFSYPGTHNRQRAPVYELHFQPYNQ